MDALENISDAVKDINRNLLLLQGDSRSVILDRTLEKAIKVISNFEFNEMHDIRTMVEGGK